MNDRELLEMAAKSAGIGISIPDDADGIFVLLGRQWNPLTNDGDALRLAVKLNINITHTLFGVDANLPGSPISFEGWGDTRLAATRRAIVRAAAEIGLLMK